MKNYQVTIGYKAVVCISLKADNDEQAKIKAIDIMNKQRDKMWTKRYVDLQDDSYDAYGILNMDETWNMI